MTTMSTNNPAGLESRHTTEAEFAIDARDVLAGRWDNVRLGVGR